MKEKQRSKYSALKASGVALAVTCGLAASLFAGAPTAQASSSSVRFDQACEAPATMTAAAQADLAKRSSINHLGSKLFCVSVESNTMKSGQRVVTDGDKLQMKIVPRYKNVTFSKVPVIEWKGNTAKNLQKVVFKKGKDGTWSSTMTVPRSASGKAMYGNVLIDGKVQVTAANKTAKTMNIQSRNIHLEPIRVDYKLSGVNPTIVGKAKVGAVIEAKMSKAPHADRVSYLWEINGKTVSTSSKFKVNAKYVGKKITVKVILKDDINRETLTLKSAAVTIVK